MCGYIGSLVKAQRATLAVYNFSACCVFVCVYFYFTSTPTIFIITVLWIISTFKHFHCIPFQAVQVESEKRILFDAEKPFVRIREM